MIKLLKKDKVDYSVKFYKGYMINENGEEYKFYLMARNKKLAAKFIYDYVNKKGFPYHIFPGENEVHTISIEEVSMDDYATDRQAEVIN